MHGGEDYVMCVGSESPFPATKLHVHTLTFMVRRPTSGEHMLTALVITGILAASIIGLTILSAIKDLEDDYCASSFEIRSLMLSI